MAVRGSPPFFWPHLNQKLEHDMMNGGHAATGALAGASLVAAVDAAGLATISPGAYLAYTAVTTGAALWPDIDHPASMVSKSGGDLTYSIGETLRGVARGTYQRTRGPHDPDDHTGEHRGLLHTVPCALLVGGGLLWGTIMSPWVGPIALVLILAPAIRSLSWTVHATWSTLVDSLPLPDRKRRNLKRALGLGALRTVLGAFVAAVITTAVLTYGYGADLYGWMFALAVTVGMITHVAGDGATTEGAPWSFPFKRRCATCREHGRKPCQRWRRCHNLPAFARWSVGDRWTPEPLVTVASLALTGVVIVGCAG